MSELGGLLLEMPRYSCGAYGGVLGLPPPVALSKVDEQVRLHLDRNVLVSIQQLLVGVPQHRHSLLPIHKQAST